MPGDRVIRVELIGAPVAKGRPRFVRATGHAYQPEKTRRFETDLRYAAAEAMAGRQPLDCAVDLKVNVFLPIPDSWSGKKKREAAAGALLPTKKPDCSNFQKAAEDALNMIVFRDDAQIVSATVTKRYSERPRLVIEVRPTPLLYLDHNTGEVRDAALPLLEARP